MITAFGRKAQIHVQQLMKLTLTKLLDQHMPLYATETFLAQKQSLMGRVIVQIQAPKMNAKPRKITFTVKKVPHVFLKAGIFTLSVT